MQRFGFKLGFAVYWLLFAVLSFFEARSPGYVRNPEMAPYPWGGLFFILALLALLVAAFYAVLLPPRFRQSYWRLPLALALCAALLAASIITTGTDLPGLSYMPGIFAFLTLIVLSVVSLCTVVSALWRRSRTAP